MGPTVIDRASPAGWLLTRRFAAHAECHRAGAHLACAQIARLHGIARRRLPAALELEQALQELADKCTREGGSA